MNYTDYFDELNKPDVFDNMFTKLNCNSDKEQYSFDPMNTVPSSDEEVKLCFEYQQEGIASRCKYGLYKIYKDYDGLSLLEAYKKVLLKSVGEKIDN